MFAGAGVSGASRGCTERGPPIGQHAAGQTRKSDTRVALICEGEMVRDDALQQLLEEGDVDSQLLKSFETATELGDSLL